MRIAPCGWIACQQNRHRLWRSLFPRLSEGLAGLDPAMTIKSLRWVRPMSLPNEPQAPEGYTVTRLQKKLDEAPT